MGHKQFNPFLIHIFLFRLLSYSFNSFIMLNACLRVLRSERERKTKHRTSLQNFWNRGPRSSVDFHARADPWGLQKYWLPHFYARAWTQTLELKITLHGSPLEHECPRSSGHHWLLNYWELAFHARAALSSLEQTCRILDFPELFLRLILAFKLK